MLGHQLPAPPPCESHSNALPEFFNWPEAGVAPSVPATYLMEIGETVFRARTWRVPVTREAQSYLEIIRFAAANHLCVDLQYHGSVRRIEPYSLRRTQTGNILQHATRSSDDEDRSYRIDRMQGAKTTQQSFVPRYMVELRPQGAAVVEPSAVR